MITVVTFWWNKWEGNLGPDYVNKLYNSLKRNTSIPFDFYCFTDNLSALQVRSIQFTPLFQWNLNKYLTFDQKFGLTGRVLLLDLDVVITGNIDHILSFNEDFITCEGAYQKGLAGGSIVGTTAEYGRGLLYLITAYKNQIEKETQGSERIFIRKYVPEAKFWQHRYHGIYSYKVDCKNGLPDGARIVRFHGLPRIHDVADNWVHAEDTETGGVS